MTRGSQGVAVPKNPEPTRRRLIAAAERLFAERGVRAVSLREINLAAGQRNASALHYHFGSRKGLLRAVLDQHVDRIRDRRLELLQEESSRGIPDMRTAARVLIEPLAEPLGAGKSGRSFLRILPQVLTDSSIPREKVAHVIGDTAREYVYELLSPYCSWLPPRVLSERLFVAHIQVVHAIAARAREIDSRSGRRPHLSHELFVANLCDMFVGAVSAPVSGETAGALASAGTDRGEVSSCLEQGAPEEFRVA